MPRTCSVCSHPHRKEIDDAVVTGVPVLQIEKRFAISRMNVRRHMKHMMTIVKRHDEVQELARGGDLRSKILLREADLLRVLQKAEENGDLPTTISAIRELRQFYELQGRLIGSLKPQEVSVLTVNLDEHTSRRIAETYLQRHPRQQQEDVGE